MKRLLLKALTAQNKALYVAFHESLEENFEALVEMLNEDDFPVEVSFDGYSKIFSDTGELERFIERLETRLDAVG